MPFKPTFWAAARLSLLMLAGTGLSAGAAAQGYPSRPVHLTVHNSPGSAPDVLAVDALAKAAPDGYNLLVGGDGPITILPNLQKNLPYDARRALLPEVPTVAETCAGFRAGTWLGLFAPAGTPQAVLDPLASEVNRILSSPAARKELAAQGIETSRLSPRAFAQQVGQEYTRYAQIVKSAGIQAD